MKILMAWIGWQDITAPTRDHTEIGPICSAAEDRSFDRLILLSNWTGEKADHAATYVEWLRPRVNANIFFKQAPLEDPTNISAIHKIVVDEIEDCVEQIAGIPELTFHLSSGTWAMALVWAILSTTRFPAELLQTSKEGGVKTTEIPFDVSAELLPKIMEPADAKLVELSSNLEVGTFGDLIFRSPAMERLATKAEKAAARSVPILIEGETGTEKELLAKAIHFSGPRRDKPFRTLNCGAIKAEQTDTKIHRASGMAFGLAEGLEQASGGTLYLNEIEMLPLQAQYSLQLLLEEKNDKNTTDSTYGLADTRIIAATSNNLFDAVTAGRFREELFYQLAVLVLKIPPLRERRGDLGPLIEMLLERINIQSSSEPGFENKTLTPGAKNVLLQRPWHGNIRELENSLRRAAIWSDTSQITEEDVWDAIFTSPSPAAPTDGILDKPIDQGVDLPEVMAKVARHYIKRAITHAEGNKTSAAKLVGLSSYQTLTNWIKKYEAE